MSDEVLRRPPAELSSRATDTQPSQIRAMFDRAERHGGDLVRLEIGEPDFATPTHIIESAFDATLEGETHYTPNAGALELRRAIAEKMDAENNVSYDPESEILVGNGAMEALYLALLTVVDPGDEVVVPMPGWPNYLAQISLVGGESIPVQLPKEQGFSFDATRVAEAISEDTAAIIINSPCNPTGRVYDSSEVCAIVEEAAAHDAYVIVDEIYEGLLYEGDSTSIAAQTDYPDHVLTVNGCSKKYAMTGWRLGWLAGSEGVIGPATKLHESTTSCASTMSQNAAIAALTGDQAPIRKMKSAFRERRDYVVERIEDLPAVTSPTPEGAFYAFLDFSELDGSSMEIAKRLLYDYGVVTAPGIGFSEHADDFVRISFANNVDRLEAGFDRINEMVRDAVGN